jgi:hypothetical protein
VLSVSSHPVFVRFAENNKRFHTTYGSCEEHWHSKIVHVGPYAWNMSELVDAHKDVTALMAAVLLKDWQALIHLIDGLTERESKAVAVCLTGLLGQAVRDFAANADMEPIEFWLTVMQGNHPEDPLG